jgi:hypothetical protein
MLVAEPEYHSVLVDFMGMLKTKNQSLEFNLVGEDFSNFGPRSIPRYTLLKALEMFDSVTPKVREILGVDSQPEITGI